MKSKKWLIIIGLAILVIILIGVIKGKSGDKSVEVNSEKVKEQTIVETVAASGKIQPETEVIISSDVSGEIIELPVKEGQRVEIGQLLVKINPDLVESAMNRAEAALNTSRANLLGAKARLAQSESQFVNAKASFERNEKLHKDKVISQAEFDQAKANFEVAKADVDASTESVEAAKYNVKSAEATLNEAKDNLGRTSIYSPIKGTVTQLNKEQGERVVGTAQMAGTEIMKVSDLSVMEVAVEVNENDIVRVNNGDTTEIEVDAFFGELFLGVVTEIANSANVTGVSADQVTNFDIKIRILPNSYEKLMRGENNDISPFRPGMSATVDIRTKAAINVLSVPIQAVTTRSVKNEKDSTSSKEKQLSSKDEVDEVVFLVQDGIAKKVKVETGIQNTSVIEIISGLNLDDEVVVGPYSIVSKRLKDGDPIKVVDKSKLFTPKK
tara:strand:- start:60929 stop:62248 length:1320 start_codon:yes stop_codon:yes gene_type:complete